MTPIADMVRRMMEAGSSNDLILIAIEGAESSRPVDSPVDKAAQRRREWDRHRKQRERELAHTSTGNPPDPVESADGASNISKKDISKKDSIRASRLSADASKLPEWRDWAAEQGMTLGEIDGQFARFRDYWISKSGKDATKTNWLGTWRNWCRNFLERNPRGNGKDHPDEAWRRAIL